MGRMIRKQVYIEARQEELLKRRAKELGASEAELIRRAIDQNLQVLEVFGLDSEAWESEKEYIKDRRCIEVPQTGRTWTREELYDERLRRFSS